MNPTLKVQQDWRIPTDQHGVFRALAQYMRLEDTRGLTPDVIVSRSEAMRKRLGQTKR